MKVLLEKHYTVRTALRYLWRATLLRCPVCGVSPVFKPLRQTRSIKDWFTPLAKCSTCHYKYDREPGYFLMSIWAINYTFSGLIGIAIYLYLEMNYELPVNRLAVAVVTPILLISVIFARHSKTYFLAIDHFLDPRESYGPPQQS